MTNASPVRPTFLQLIKEGKVNESLRSEWTMTYCVDPVEEAVSVHRHNCIVQTLGAFSVAIGVVSITAIAMQGEALQTRLFCLDVIVYLICLVVTYDLWFRQPKEARNAASFMSCLSCVYYDLLASEPTAYQMEYFYLCERIRDHFYDQASRIRTLQVSEIDSPELNDLRTKFKEAHALLVPLRLVLDDPEDYFPDNKPDESWMLSGSGMLDLK